jgi:cell division protein FtsI (penicillin-binding protein 3)
MLLVLFKTVSIQLEGRSNVFASTEEKMPVRTVKKTPRRGEILDVNYTPLVTSVSFYDIHMDPTVVDQKTFDADLGDLSDGLARFYPQRTAREWEIYIRTGRNRGSRYLLIQKKVTNDERKQLRELPIFKLGRLKGGIIDSDETILRKRPHAELMKRTLGYYKNEGGVELKVGIEGAFHEYLAGEPGEEIEQKFTTGWKKTGQIVKEAVEGADVVTSIDKEIQEVAHSELERQLRNQGAKSGCVIVMDVKTGFVKAIANLTQAVDGEYYELYNHAVGTKEVPGSTFKVGDKDKLDDP